MKKVEKFYQIGLLKPDEKVELISGEIYKMSPIGLKMKEISYPQPNDTELVT